MLNSFLAWNYDKTSDLTYHMIAKIRAIPIHVKQKITNMDLSIIVLPIIICKLLKLLREQSFSEVSMNSISLFS